MKRKKRSKMFLQELRNLIGALKHMKPGETHVLSINANYGNYQLVIRPKLSKAREGQELRNGDEQEGDARTIEINGEIHHLFATPAELRTHPSKEQIIDNLKDTVIMRGVSIHLKDPKGDGEHLNALTEEENGLHAREYINLAGNKGEDIIDRVESDDEISYETYQLIQKDIIAALKKDQDESIESLDTTD